MNYSGDNKLKIKTTISSGYFEGSEFLSQTEYVYPTIQEWIALISGAKLVTTTSFHGVAFCVICHTSFVYFPIQGKSGRGNNRVYDLLKMFGLENRIVCDKKTINDIANFSIDWNRVESILCENREKSIDFLKRALVVE